MVIAPLELLGALVIGAAMGMLGGGGSILTVPVFVYAAGLDPKLAIAASLPVVALTSASAAIAHWRLGNVQVRTALIFGIMAAVGSYAGARLATLISGTTQFALLAIVMLVAAFRMMFGDTTSPEAIDTKFHIAYGTLVPVALVLGVLTGIVGIGGGFLIVPALVIVCRLPMRAAVGTSLMVIAMNAASGTLGYAGSVAIPWHLVLVFSGIAVVGSLAASRMSPHIPQAGLRRGFGVFLVVLAILILVQNRQAFTGLLAS